MVNDEELTNKQHRLGMILKTLEKATK